MTVASPCTNVCTIDRRTGWCRGCGRDVDEITAWPLANDLRRKAIVAALPARMAQLDRKRLWR